MKILLISAILLITIASVQNQNFSAVYSLTWLPGHCQQILQQNRSCDPQFLQKWDHQSFTIHGLWANYAGATDPVQQFLPSLHTSYIEQLFQLFPPQSSKPKYGSRYSYNQKYFLWIYQWRKHGPQYASIQLNLRKKHYAMPKDLINQQIQKYFFKDTLDIYNNKIKARKIPKYISTQKQLADALGIPASTFYLLCNPSGVLKQVRICLILSYGIKGIQYTLDTTCRVKNMNCDKDRFELKDFKIMRNKARVMN